MTVDLRDGVTVSVVDPRPVPVTPVVLGARGVQGPPGLGVVAWSQGPGVFAGSGSGYQWRCPQDATVASVAVVLGTPPVSGSVVVDVLAGGVSLWADPAGRPSVGPGLGVVLVAPDVGRAGLGSGVLLSVVVVSGDASARDLVVTVHLTSPTT